MSVASAISSGVDDFVTIIGFFIAGISLQFIGAFIEQVKEQWKLLVTVGLFAELSIAFSILWYSFSTTSTTQYQWFEVVAYLFFYSLFPLNCVYDAIYRKDCFIKTDWIYNILSLASKFSLFWLQVGEVEINLYESMWSEASIYIFGMFVPLIILVVGLYFTPKCPTLSIDEVCNNVVVSEEWSLYKILTTLRLTAKPRVEIIHVTNKSRKRLGV
tara:strand:- start:35 stop:679 length:645 start_codon:yes stop_codon:yes gene_type:complete